MDLFAPKKSKREQVYDFIKSKGRCRTSEIIKFGSSIYHNRAERDCRDLSTENRIWRVADNVKQASQYKDSKEDVWSVFPADREYLTPAPKDIGEKIR